LINKGSVTIQVEKITCWSFNGHSIVLAGNTLLETGKSIALLRDHALPSGMYYVLVEIADGTTWGAGIMKE
jgi:hypothetical protein